MKSFYQRVQTQYQKLQAKINKALESGRFYEFSKFKQERLWARLQRCRLQLKHLATGTAVAAALLMSAPSAMAQYVPPPFLQGGRGHASYGLIDDTWSGDFVDLDNDGDMDYATTVPGAGNFKVIEYYENIGGIDSASYVQRTGTDNPFNGIPDVESVYFVDIDNDGDMDCFGGCRYYTNNYANNNQAIWYIENQGDASNPNFVLQPNSNNPIPDVGNFFPSSASATIAAFVDFDGDGDQDCFVSAYDYQSGNLKGQIIYMRNDGTATTPNFTRLNSTLNPFDIYTTDIRDGRFIRMEFVDMDKDGDQDVFWSATAGFLFNNSTERLVYYENTGSGVYVTTTTTPVDSINGGTGPGSLDVNGFILVDDQNDTDLDVILRNGAWHENLDTVKHLNIFYPIEGTELLEQVSSSPNPAKDWLQFDQAISGIIGIYDQTGRLIAQRELELANGMDLSDLPNGLYFFYWRDDKRTLQEKIQVQR